MTPNDRWGKVAHEVAWRLEEAAFNEMVAKGRQDLIAEVYRTGYECKRGPDGVWTFTVAGEPVLRVLIGLDGIETVH